MSIFSLSSSPPGLKALQEGFFQSSYKNLVKSPNERFWWHSMPLPNGDRVDGNHPDKEIQLKFWQGLKINNRDGLKGKTVLDVGANDGFFTLAALAAGAAKATAIDTTLWGTFPHNLQFASELWKATPEVIVHDYRNYAFPETYDVIFYFGVLYHEENVFEAIRFLRTLLKDGGLLYIESQMSQIQSELPLFESASDIYPTVAKMGREGLEMVGISNYLFPNDAAMFNLAQSYGFQCEALQGEHNPYSTEHPTRCLYKFVK
jgi:SAM-dependent methyltransferase